MPRRASWAKALFFYESGKLRRGDTDKAFGFHVGIWWHDTERLVAFLQPITEIKAAGHLIDSDLSHDVCWETARQEFHRHVTGEYFDLPRGRIVWDTLHAAELFYHGNATPREVFEELARLYGLPRWEARLDEHYLTGDALEEFYRLE